MPSNIPNSLVPVLFGIQLTLALNPVNATDYRFGSRAGDFVIVAADTARALGWSLGTLQPPDPGAVYWRGSASDATFAHFDLSDLAYGTITGDVSLSYTVQTSYGGDLWNGQVAVANGAWSAPGSAPGFTVIAGSSGPNGSFASGAVATWNMPQSEFQRFIDQPSSFYGLVVAAGSGSSAHFSGLPTLRGTANTPAIIISGGADWSAARWNSGSTRLIIDQASQVSGGNILIRTGATLDVSGSAALGAGAFSGAIANGGTLSLGSSANQSLGGVLTGNGTLRKLGSGSLILAGNNTMSGGLIIDGGRVRGEANTLGQGPITINNTGVLLVSNTWPFGGGNSYYASTTRVPSVTVNAGGELHFDESSGHLAGIPQLYLNGGAVTGGGGLYEEQLGTLFLDSGQEAITAGGATTSTMSCRIGLTADNNSITVEPNSSLHITSAMINSNWWANGGRGGFIKSGSGTLVLSGANTYTGNTVVSDGVLELADDSQLKFVVTDAPVANLVSGAGTVMFNGDFVIDTTNVSANTGHIWMLADLTQLKADTAFGATFRVVGFADADGDGVWTMSDAKGEWSFDESTAELTLNIETDYNAWKSVRGVRGGKSDDDDCDGMTNHQEYAFGLDPLSARSHQPITREFNKVTGQLTYQRRNHALTGLNYTIWYSTDLSSWSQDVGATESQGVPDGDDVERVTVTMSAALMSEPKLFVQVHAN